MLSEILSMMQLIDQLGIFNKLFFSSIEIGDDYSGVEIYVR